MPSVSQATSETENTTTEPAEVTEPLSGEGASQTPPQAQPQVQTRGPKIIPMPSNAIARMKQEAQEKGAKLALEKEARANGFRSYAEMKQYLERRAKKPTTAPQEQEEMIQDDVTLDDAETEEFETEEEETPPVTKPSPKGKPQAQGKPQGQQGQPSKGKPQDSRLARENQRLQEERRQLNQQRITLEKRNKALQRQNEALQYEHELRFTALQSGVKEVDYAVHLVKQELDRRARNNEPLESFSEHEFFSSMRRSHPYLFGVESRPATTSETAPTNAGVQAGMPQGAPPGTRTVQEASASDARKLSPDDFRKRLASLGLGDPTGGSP